MQPLAMLIEDLYEQIKLAKIKVQLGWSYASISKFYSR